MTEVQFICSRLLKNLRCLFTRMRERKREREKERESYLPGQSFEIVVLGVDVHL